MPYCPNCRARVGKTAKFCKSCGFDLKEDEPQVDVEEGETEDVATEQVKQTEPTDASILDLKCVNHPERDTAGICSNCGKGICLYCQTMVEGKGYCPSCVEKIVKKEIQPRMVNQVPRGTGSLSPSKSKPRLMWLPIAWGVAVAFLLQFVIGFVLGLSVSNLSNMSYGAWVAAALGIAFSYFAGGFTAGVIARSRGALHGMLASLSACVLGMIISYGLGGY